MFNSLLKPRLNWNHISSYRERKITDSTNAYATVEYTINVCSPLLKGRSILFLSDTHFRDINFPYSSLAESINELSPDWIVFGGDLVHFMTNVKSAINFLSKLKAKNSKLAILGNWDIQKIQWQHDTFWEKVYKQSGFELLTNSTKEFPGISFAGITPYTPANPLPYLDFKNNFYYKLKTLIENNRLNNKFSCLLSHSPDTFIKDFSIKNDILPDLVLCGHTHGGQIRIPFFGALVTSSSFWKLFEYGHYYHKNRKANMIISNGIGCTGPKFRLFCKPEIVRIHFG